MAKCPDDAGRGSDIASAEVAPQMVLSLEGAPCLPQWTRSAGPVAAASTADIIMLRALLTPPFQMRGGTGWDLRRGKGPDRFPYRDEGLSRSCPVGEAEKLMDEQIEALDDRAPLRAIHGGSRAQKGVTITADWTFKLLV